MTFNRTVTAFALITVLIGGAAGGYGIRAATEPEDRTVTVLHESSKPTAPDPGFTFGR